MTTAGARPVSTADELRRIEHIDRLVSTGSSGIEELIGMLEDPSWSVRRAAIAALAAEGAAALDRLCAELRDRRESETRIAAVVDALSSLDAKGQVEQALAAMVPTADAALLADIAQILGRRRTSASLPTLVSLSAHADDNVAVAAIEALGRIGGRAAVDSLVDAVRSGVFFRVFPAIDVLGRSGDPRAVAPLSELLAQPQYATEAARALGRTGDVGAVQPLAALLSARSGAIVRVAALAMADLYHRHRERFGNGLAIVASLGRLENGLAISRHLTRALIEGDPAEQVAICLVLGELQQPAAGPALSALLNGPAEVAAAAGAALRRLGTRVEAQILQGLRDGDSVQRRVLLPLLSRGAAGPEITACLEDADPEVRALACDALARLGLTSLVSAIFPLLGDESPRVSYAAVAAIQSLGSLETERLALEAARSPQTVVRRAAIRILSYFGWSTSLDALLNALKDPDEKVREAAIQGLPFMEDGRALDALFAVARDPSPRARAAAMRSLAHSTRDFRVMSYLLEGLGDADAWVRYYACQSLGKLEFEPAAAPIAGMLADAAGQVRVAAVEALSCLKGEIATRTLEAAVLDKDSDIQRAAIIGLGIARRTEALPFIERATRSPDLATRLVALSAVAALRAPGYLDVLEDAASDADEKVRTAALGFLAAAPEKEATRALTKLLSASANPDQVMSALLVLGDERVAGVTAALREADDEAAPALTSVLARLRRPDALAALFSAMTFDNVAARKAAASTLAGIGGKEATAALRAAAANDPAPEMRQICALLLAR